MKLAIALVAALPLVGLAACGGAGSTTTATTAQGPATTATPARGEIPPADTGTKGGDNSIQEFGEEAGSSDREQAAVALHGYLDARATGRWAKACSDMATPTQRSIQQLAGSSKQLGGKGCGPILAALSAGIPAAGRAEFATAGGIRLRVEGDRAFALYHGAHGTASFIPMAREAGAWKVAALAPSTLP